LGATAPSPAPRSAAVAELATAADAVCACADAACAESAYQRLHARRSELHDPSDESGLDVEDDRGLVCWSQKTGKPLASEIVAWIADSADTICACVDEACGESHAEELRAKLRSRGDVRATSTQKAALAKGYERINGCRGRFVSEGELAARAAETWANEVCACADAQCALDAMQRGADSLKKYRNASGTRKHADRIVAATGRTRECAQRLVNGASDESGAATKPSEAKDSKPAD
jgi:hypothetical protein